MIFFDFSCIFLWEEVILRAIPFGQRVRYGADKGNFDGLMKR